MTQHEHWTRRTLLKATAGSGVLALAGLSPTRAAALAQTVKPAGKRKSVSTLDPTIIIDGTDVRALAMRALDAAKSAGAMYADVRLTRRLTQQLGRLFSGEGERIAVGVRAYIRGGWGFASSPYWNADDVVTLAREAASQAKTNAAAALDTPNWTPIPVASGAWSTPIEVDPFVLPLEEKLDLMAAWYAPVQRYRYFSGAHTIRFTREERAVATTDGAYFTQTLYESGGVVDFQRETTHGPQRFGSASARGVANTAAGWEVLTEADIPGQIPRLYGEANPEATEPPMKPGDIGRYDVVFDAITMASLVTSTIGVATQVDRALGYEANASGTSYLGPDPLAFLGMYQAASPLVTIRADRSMPRGLATVKWDDEGVVPEDFVLVNSGVLVDYQTTREQAQWLAPWYQKRGVPVRSHGCAAADSAISITMQHRPNLTLEPGLQDIEFADLVSTTKKGLAIIGGQFQTDFQARTGSGRGLIREIVNGKLGAVITGLECFFNTPQLWKNIKAIGGAASVVQITSSESKGEPAQTTSHSIRAVPAQIASVDFIDLRRKG
jgi:TldD protein